jgi:hypothetical protein
LSRATSSKESSSASIVKFGGPRRFIIGDGLGVLEGSRRAQRFPEIRRGSESREALSAREQTAAQAHLAQVRDASNNGKVKRTDLIAAVLRTAPSDDPAGAHQGS